jgi:hypothetical protein
MSSNTIPGMVDYKVSPPPGTPAEAAIEAAKQNQIQISRLQSLAGGKKYKKRSLKKIGGNGIPVPQPTTNYNTIGTSPNEIIAANLTSATQAGAYAKFDNLAVQPNPTTGGYKQKFTRKIKSRRKNKTNKNRSNQTNKKKTKNTKNKTNKNRKHKKKTKVYK